MVKKIMKWSDLPRTVRARNFLSIMTAIALFAGEVAPSLAGTMTVPGSFAVSPTGAATYSIPISVPPGAAGMMPALSLTYSSQGGNGSLGVGWALAGLPTIGRCGRTLAQDGAVGGVSYDANDRFCMNGQRLVAISGTYGADGTQYRTEVESFSKIISHGTAGSGPAWFEVHTRSGQTMELGNTTGSRILAQGSASARLWAVNKVSDSKSNYYTVTYNTDAANGQYYPTRVDYTGNAAAGLNPYNSVVFGYDARPDVIPQYQAGSLVTTALRMREVITYAGSTAISNYRFTYEQSGPANRSRVTKISLCDGNGSCLPATSVNWTSQAGGFGSYSQWGTQFTTETGWTDMKTVPRMLVDVNGDGLPDIVGFGAGAVAVSLNTGAGFASYQEWNTQYTTSAGWINQNVNPRMVVDVNGDGLPDIVGFGSGGVGVSLNTGTSFGSPQLWSTQFSTGAGWTDTNTLPRMLADVNGDGLPDIVGFGADAVVVALNTGTSFGTGYQPWSTQYTTTAGWIDQNVNPRMLVDVNGDGLPDIVGFGSGGVGVSLNTGTSFGSPQLWSTQFSTSTGWTDANTFPRMLVDVNGDGLPDIVGFGAGAVAVSLNTGTSFGSYQQWSTQYTTGAGWVDQNVTPRLVVDVNGDGLPDIVGFGSGGVGVSLNTGTSFGITQLWSTQFSTGTGWTDTNKFPRMVADVLGNSLPGIVGFGSGAVAISQNPNGLPPDLVSAVVNGLGASTAMTYQPGTRSSVVTKGTGTAFPLLDLVSAAYVVSQVDSSNGIGGTVATSYTYSGGRIDARRRAFLGYAQTGVKDLQTSIATMTTYRQDFPYIGSVASVAKGLSAGTTPGGAANQGMALTQSSNTYQFSNASGAASVSTPSLTSAPYRVWLSQTTSSGSDLDGSALPSMTTTNQYDAYLNPTQVVTSSSDGFSKTTVSSYSNDTSNWYLGRLTRSSVTGVAP